jgi:hypothetical protein
MIAGPCRQASCHPGLAAAVAHISPPQRRLRARGPQERNCVPVGRVPSRGARLAFPSECKIFRLAARQLCSFACAAGKMISPLQGAYLLCCPAHCGGAASGAGEAGWVWLGFAGATGWAAPGTARAFRRPCFFAPGWRGGFEPALSGATAGAGLLEASASSGGTPSVTPGSLR